MIVAKKDKKPPRPYGFSSKEAIGNNSQRVSQFKSENRKMVWKPAAIGAGIGGGAGAVTGTVVGGPLVGLAGGGAGAAFGGLTGAAYGLDRRREAAQTDAWDKGVASGDIRQSRKGERVSEYHQNRVVPKAKWQKAHIKNISAENERLKQEAAEREANVTYIHKSAFGVDHRISKGEYMDSQEKVQLHRRKANRRGQASSTALGVTSGVGAASLMFPSVARSAVMYPSYHVATKAGSKAFEQTMAGSTRRAKVSTTIMDSAKAVNRNPGKVIAGTLVAGLGTAGGLKLAQMGHNAHSNTLAREYNKKNRNSKIKIVPVTHKNRF